MTVLYKAWHTIPGCALARSWKTSFHSLNTFAWVQVINTVIYFRKHCLAILQHQRQLLLQHSVTFITLVCQISLLFFAANVHLSVVRVSFLFWFFKVGENITLFKLEMQGQEII